MIIHRAFVAALATLFAAAPGRASGSPGPCTEASAVALEIASELGDPDDDVAMLEYLHARLPARLAEHDLCVDPTATRRVVATVAWSNAVRGDYAIALRATAPQAEPFEPGATTCEACATIELVDAIGTQVPEALAGLKEPEIAAPARRVAPATAPAPVAEGEPARARASLRDRPRFGRWGHAGIGLTTAGLAGVVIGAALWAQGSVPHPADHQYRLVLRPAGISLVVGGVLGIAAGSTMIALDPKRSRRTTVRPAFGRHQAGVAISGAF